MHPRYDVQLIPHVCTMLLLCNGIGGLEESISAAASAQNSSGLMLRG